MHVLSEVPVRPSSLERFRPVLGTRYAEVERAIERAHELLAGRVIWHVNSTARGGGVAEMLHTLLAYARGAGTDVRWVTIRGNEQFFRITKRIHNHLHGHDGDDGELGEAERRVYQRCLAENADELVGLVGERDIVYLHDPQTAGLTETVRAAAGHVIWRCHVGLDTPNTRARQAWEFLRGYLDRADAYVFSRRAFAWEGLDDRRLWVIAPSIDAFSPKNQELAPAAVSAILGRVGLASDRAGEPEFVRQDGSHGQVEHAAELDQEGPVPDDVPLVAQISRWDRLKDPAGVLLAFERCRRSSAHLLLAGPSVDGVADDPEGREVLAEIRELRNGLPAELRARIHLASLPMDDVEENAAIVNALQRRADVVIQKSLAEGFGLTVAEAMWKARPVVASRIGGIQDQIVDGESGLLIDEPRDLDAAAAAIDRLLHDPLAARAIGNAAHERVRAAFLGPRHLLEYVGLLGKLIAGEGGGRPAAEA